MKESANALRRRSLLATWRWLQLLIVIILFTISCNNREPPAEIRTRDSSTET